MTLEQAGYAVLALAHGAQVHGEAMPYRIRLHRHGDGDWSVRVRWDRHGVEEVMAWEATDYSQN